VAGAAVVVAGDDPLPVEAVGSGSADSDVTTGEVDAGAPPGERWGASAL
jgi:hypothetical protein